MEQKNDDKIEKMRKKMDNTLEATLKGLKSNKTASTATNPRSDVNERQDSQPSGSKTDKSIAVRAYNNGNSDSENDDYPLRASQMKDLIHPTEPLFQNESDVDVTILSSKEPDEEDNHTYSKKKVLDWYYSAKRVLQDESNRPIEVSRV